MHEGTFDLLTLSLAPGVSPRHVREIRDRGLVREAVTAPDRVVELGPEARRSLSCGEARRRAQAEVDRSRRVDVQIVGLDDAGYPPLLARTYDPPPVLWVRGVLRPGEGEECVAVVGSRKASPGGLALARALGRDLAGAGLTVVSGLARGIDTVAHEGALHSHGRTVAVLGSGLDRVYPPENARLAERVAEAGAVVSEFPLGTPPLAPHFPRRNRVIAGWGRAVVVAEAALKSGALGTARAALEEGRDVMAVPGHPSAETFAGTNALIRDGAVLVRGAADVLEELGLAAADVAIPAPTDDDVLLALKRDVPTSLEELVARSGREVPELLRRLSLLEVGDRVRRLPGPLYVRN
ncbi:MAG TPA: DNA-processing protein DprA [Vicinamibacteria bacterium]|jgi:DNA processing protein